MDSPPPASPDMQFSRAVSAIQDEPPKSVSPQTAEKQDYQDHSNIFNPEQKIPQSPYHFETQQGPFHVGRLLQDNKHPACSDDEHRSNAVGTESILVKSEDGEPSRKRRKHTPKQNRNGFNFSSDNFQAGVETEENEGAHFVDKYVKSLLIIIKWSSHATQQF